MILVKNPKMKKGWVKKEAVPKGTAQVQGGNAQGAYTTT
jgi:hypothetical protein